MARRMVYHGTEPLRMLSPEDILIEKGSVVIVDTKIQAEELEELGFREEKVGTTNKNKLKEGE